MTNQPAPPFSCNYTPNVAELLTQLDISLAISTYQAGKVVFLSPDGINNMRQLPRNFDKPMGMVFHGDRMALATREEVIVFRNAPGLAKDYPGKPNFYDSFFVPRATYYTGTVDIHDMEWDKNGNLWAVSTLFSCLANINENYSFEPQWKPPFIKTMESADFCHLNGMAMVDGLPRYVTMFGQTTTPKGWRQGIETNGLIMDITTNEIVANNLAMPHSPRWFDGNLYCLLSATGDFVRVDTQNGKYEVVRRLKGFVRGMAKHGDYVFIGLSRLRQNSSVFRDLPITKDAVHCGIEIIHLPTGANVGHIRYQSSVEEIYDVQVVPNSFRPGILNHTAETHKGALHLPQGCYWSKTEQ